MKHVALSMIILVAVASLGLLGAYAGFVDTEVSSDNTIEAGTLDLVLSDGQPSGFGHGVQQTWNIYLAFPHDSVSRSVQLMNFGTVGDYVDVESISTNDWAVSPPPPRPLRPKDTVLIITEMTYAGGTAHEDTIVWVDDVTWPVGGAYHFDAGRITDYDGDGLISLDDLEKQTVEFSPAPNSGSLSFRMSVQFEPQFGPHPDNEYQDIETNTTVIFTLR
jgi:spore coat-associated protein N